MSVAFVKSGYERGYVPLATLFASMYLADIIIVNSDCVVPTSAPFISGLDPQWRQVLFFENH